jgi:hypothetical protein
MKPLKRLSKKAAEFCELCGYDPKLISKLIKGDFLFILKFETKEEMDKEGVDYSYPYKIYDSWNMYEYFKKACDK